MLDINKAIDKLKHIKLHGGIVGKTTTLLIVLSLVIGSVCFVVKNQDYIIILLLVLLGLVFYGMKRCFDFAEKNPQAAIMEGAEFLIHEQIMQGNKDTPLIEVQNAEMELDHPVETSLLGNVEEPDRASTATLERGR